jgi:hypothetical protein
MSGPTSTAAVVASLESIRGNANIALQEIEAGRLDSPNIRTAIQNLREAWPILNEHLHAAGMTDVFRPVDESGL